MYVSRHRIKPYETLKICRSSPDFYALTAVDFSDELPRVASFTVGCDIIYVNGIINLREIKRFHGPRKRMPSIIFFHIVGTPELPNVITKTTPRDARVNAINTLQSKIVGKANCSKRITSNAFVLTVVCIPE